MNKYYSIKEIFKYLPKEEDWAFHNFRIKLDNDRMTERADILQSENVGSFCSL